MHYSSSSEKAATAAKGTVPPLAGTPPVVLSERSLLLLAVVRLFVGFLWFQQLAWKMPPGFGGLRRYAISEAQHTFVPGYSLLLKQVFLANFPLLGTGVWIAELVVGISLLFGLFTRLGALLALVLSVQLYVGLAYAPGEWYWTYGMLVLLSLVFVALPAGRRLGLDAVLERRLHTNPQTGRLARWFSWFV
jgi:thiosulfate dehydrogenase [quinone] large subunit